MTLRQKTLLVVGITLASLIIVLYLTTASILFGGFSQVESQDVRQNMQRVQDAYVDELAKIDITAHDWATWDDTYGFIEDGNQEYIDTNLLDATTSRLGLNAIVYLDGAGRVVYSLGYDLAEQRTAPVPAGLLELLAPGSPLLKGPADRAGSMGALMLPEGAMLVTARPILRSDGQGPARGTLVMGRFLDSAITQEIAARTHVELDIVPAVGPLAPDLVEARGQLRLGEPPLVRAVDDQTIAGYMLLPDTDGRPALLARVAIPRPIYAQGLVSMRSQLISLLIVGLVFGGVVLLLLERLVLSPLSRLGAGVSRIEASGDLSVRVPDSGQDELAQLGGRINAMLEALEHAQQERERTDEALRHAKDAAEAANRAKSVFLANMSHELRTPLTGIIGYSELLQREAAEYGYGAIVPDLTKIRTAGTHLLTLINDILDLSKIEAGRMDLHLDRFSVAELLDDVLTTAEPLVARNRNELRLDLDGDPGEMYSDMTKVRQVLLNLLSNAAKFTECGRITVRAARVRDVGQDLVVVSVADTGIGMTPEQVSRLFQDFIQVDTSTTRRHGGTGLGLSLSRRFCDLLGGHIEVQSEAGVGSTFTAWLPAQLPDRVGPPEGEPAAEEPPDLAPELQGTVLVIDDDPAVRELLPRTLACTGLCTVAASSGAEGLRLARLLRPDVITLDVQMPGADGWGVLDAIKRDPDLADTPVIMLSIVDEHRRGMALGAAEFLLKPIDTERLLAVVHELVLSRAGGLGRPLAEEHHA